MIVCNSFDKTIAAHLPCMCQGYTDLTRLLGLDAEALEITE